MHEIQTLREEHIAAAAALLGRAFADNPGYRALLAHQSPAGRHASVSRLKRGFTAAAVRYQEAEGIWDGGRLVAASLVSAPGQYPPSLRAKALHFAYGLLAGPRAALNLLSADRHMARLHTREPHYYLFVLGVEPECQGRGYGRALLQALNTRADARALPCYLETDRESAMRLYRSVGYAVQTDEVIAGAAGFRMWTMRRPPRAHAG